MVTAIDVDHRAGGGREPVAEQCHDGPGHGARVGDVPTQRGSLSPHVFEGREPGDGPSRHGLDRSGRHQVHPDARRAEITGQIPAGGLEPGFGHPHPVIGGPGPGGVEIEADDRPPRGHERGHGVGQELERVGGDLQRHLDVIPGCVHERPPQAHLRSEADGMQGPVHPSPPVGQIFGEGRCVAGIGHVELEDLGTGARAGAELAGGAFGEAQPSARAGEHDLGSLGYCQLGHAESQRGVGEHAGDDDALFVEKAHEPRRYREAVGEPIRLYDTARRAVVDFEAGPVIRMYVCGITPYDATHLGHAATYVTYDILQRRLRDRGHQTRCVRNITDVDDDILAAADQRGVHYLDLAFAETARFDDDMAALNTLPPWSEPRATSAIADIRGFIVTAIARGYAYESEGSVYFDSRAHCGFGSLSGFGPDRMIELAREWRDDPDDPGKRDRLDFVLWQKARAGEPAWESRWGPGRPGWHVECSALALRELGTTIDIHGGGADLLYPHHECEQAQSEAVTGRPFVRHWLHQGLVHVDGRKMSKSLGNLVMVHELRGRHDPMVIRLALMTHHYRTPWPWRPELLDGARSRLDRWRRAGTGFAALPEVRACLDDDLDVPGALAAVDSAARSGHGVSRAAALLGVML